jgi:hypothetical protein
MRYLVRARLKPGREHALLKAIQDETLGRGSVAEGEYLRNMQDARLCADQTARWVEVCYCPTPLQEERPYWEEYFELTKVQDAHDRRNCRDQNGSEPWACGDCDCTQRLEEKLKYTGTSFIEENRRDSLEAIKRSHEMVGEKFASFHQVDRILAQWCPILT